MWINGTELYFILFTISKHEKRADICVQGIIKVY